MHSLLTIIRDASFRATIRVLILSNWVSLSHHQFLPLILPIPSQSLHPLPKFSGCFAVFFPMSVGAHACAKVMLAFSCIDPQSLLYPLCPVAITYLQNTLV